MVNGKDVDALPVRDISTNGNGHNIGKSYMKIHLYHLVHENVRIVAIFVSKYDAYSVTSFLTLDEDSVTTNDLEFFHCGRERDITLISFLVASLTIRRFESAFFCYEWHLSYLHPVIIK